MKRLAWIGAMALVLAAAARAAEVSLEAMTSVELRAAVAAGTTTALIPIGGTEQNGGHMVLGKHNVRVRMLAERIARQLGGTVVAPVVAYVPEGAIDPPSSHMRYAGTLSVPEKVFEATLEAAATSLRRHGLRDIVLLGDHGGYQASLARVAQRLTKQWSASGGTRVHALGEYYRAGQEDFAHWLQSRGQPREAIGQHAGLADTSLALAVDPALVRRDVLMRPARPGELDGVTGDPRLASAELGRAGIDMIVRASVDAIRRRSARH